MSIRFITNEQLNSEVLEKVQKAESFVWIGTADIKDLHIHYRGGVDSFLRILDDLVRRKIAVRLLHAKEPGPNFRKSFDKYPMLWDCMERQLCPRVHFKHIIIDDKLAYSGSANLTGAGLGIKSPYTRNFEAGFITSDQQVIEEVMKQFDEVWMGKFCKTCRRKSFCGDPIA